MERLNLPTEKIIAEIKDNIGWIVFNQPEKRNAISLSMWETIPFIIKEYSNNNEVRLVVMKGEGGKAFVSGADISEFDQVRNTPEQVEYYEKASSLAKNSLSNLKKPLIAMIDGFCIGGGMGIALSADIRIASNDSKFGIPAARLGLGYGYEGIKELMNLVGPAYAKEIFFTGNIFSSIDAERMGLLNKVVEKKHLEQYVFDFATRIAINAPLTVMASKAAINEGLKNFNEQNLDAIADMVDHCFRSEDYKEGRNAFMEKRKPNFKGK
tara:strand:- start:778 stop:1581 length:804 start_codon:yes stop_codon:yes gene_type:complete